jgi:hypothetical protein
MEAWHVVLAVADLVVLCLCRSVGKDIQEIAENPSLLGAVVCFLYICVMILGCIYGIWFLYNIFGILTGGY